MDVEFLAITKGREIYTFLYLDCDVPALAEVLARFAKDPELSLTRNDAVLAMQRIRESLAKRIPLTDSR